MFGLGLGLGQFTIFNRFINNLVRSFKIRVSADSGIFEAQNCLKSTLTKLNKL
jgi:hypothetical protein